ncbi:hypothetical protein BOX15_Mlig030890g1 [Macrostomum lignano]|uniref:BTB domain-containing protein n=1 Tax=Macrostomum lignano TaxID=282301 RepID=A0A267ESJ4_9PLAT|nr:hypothetical protein BOX15_Mlig030890g1 [Macrostomum lignano]
MQELEDSFCLAQTLGPPTVQLQSADSSNQATEQLAPQIPLTLCQRLKLSLDSGEFSDVAFLIGDAKIRFNAHRVVLASVSPVFRAMFNSPLSRQLQSLDSNHNSKLMTEAIHELSDIESSAFENLLIFAYTDCTEGVTDSNVFQTLYAAKKYLVDGLANACCEYLRQHLTVDNALTVLEHCMFLQVPSVVQPCLRLICHQWERISSDLLGCHGNTYSQDLIACVLSQDGLPCDEVEIFDWILCWAKSRKSANADADEEDKPSGSMSSLGTVGDLIDYTPLLRCVRFSRMSRRQIGSLVAPTGLLTDGQLVRILTGQDRDNLDRDTVVEFNAQPRCPSLPGEPEQLVLCDLAAAAAAVRAAAAPSQVSARLPMALPPSVTDESSSASTFVSASGLLSLADQQFAIFGSIEMRTNRRLLLTGFNLFRQPPKSESSSSRLRQVQAQQQNPSGSEMSIMAEVTSVEDVEHCLFNSRFEPNEASLECSQTVRQAVSLTEVTFPRALVLLPNQWYRLSIHVCGSGQLPPPQLLGPSQCWRSPWELDGRPVVSGNCGCAKLELRPPMLASAAAGFFQALCVCWV